ncbi:protein TolQ [Candidatus Tenderia electrophaga]|uniref:Tol-Pal system protein TolQ n=1 Tax=Candidatus Tenderia electrophaga TaxID=1748243 RepID=A0A0S2TFX8_9GAMM|nr:protein TolQ [Candidatus Tenderia electrophaga]
MSADLSLISLLINASPLVQLVMLLLLVVSIMAWTIIFNKSKSLKQARQELESFEDRFWSGGDLSRLYEQSSNHAEARGLERIFKAGFKEFIKLRQQGGPDKMAMVEGAQRIMRVNLNREADNLEGSLQFLATVGSTSPYIGLFGTVWGIMNAFRALGNVQQATLAMVAPGIAEALIATAMGLFAAIPAVIAYNRFRSDVERLVSHYDSFVDEFTSILQRQAHVPAGEDT